jgi:hypothetical protein
LSLKGRVIALKRFSKKGTALREGQQAMAEYQAAGAATGEKTARLRALRLARDADSKTQI